MTNFINEFKTKAHKKELTNADMLALCLYRTIKAKSEHKLEVLNYFIQKSYTPKAGHDWSCVHRAASDIGRITNPRVSRNEDGTLTRVRTYFGIDLNEIYTTTELELFDELRQKLKNYRGELA